MKTVAINSLSPLAYAPKRFGKVVVCLGGQSSEREISLKSGQAVFAALKQEGVEVEALDIGPTTLPQLMTAAYDRAFLALHGRGGEDGAIQGLLESIGLPYTGSGILASALAMDKVKTKQIWQAVSLPTPRYEVINTQVNPAKSVARAITFPVIVKPAHEGSSIGMCKANNQQELATALELAQRYDSSLLIEQWITGQEYTVSIVDDLVLPAIRLETARTFYDYEAKYQANDTQYICPCGLSAAEEQQLQELAWNAFVALGCKGWGRVDVMRDQAGHFWLLEVNTIPGMTDHSLVPMAAKAAGLSFAQLVLKILATTDLTKVRQTQL